MPLAGGIVARRCANVVRGSPLRRAVLAPIRSSRLGRAGLEAVATMLATIATLLCVRAISREPGPAILAVVLCLSLSRSQPSPRTRRPYAN
jgi:hypothetical protein